MKMLYGKYVQYISGEKKNIGTTWKSSSSGSFSQGCFQKHPNRRQPFQYKRSLRAPTKENALVLIAVDIGSKNTQEKDQIRIGAASTAGPEIRTVLDGILGR